MGNRNWTYEGCIHLGGSNVLTDLYLETIGWVWDSEAMDYVSDDEDLVKYTVDIDCYISDDVCHEMDKDELVSKVLATCNYNDEEAVSKAIKDQLSILVDKKLPELGKQIKEEVRRACLCSREYEYIKREVGKHVAIINLTNKIYEGITNTNWTGSRSEFTDIIRRGLKVTTLNIKKRGRGRSYMSWMVRAFHSEIRKELYKNGYTVEQVADMDKGLGNEVEELVDRNRWSCEDWVIELKVLIVPKGLNGFDEGERLHLLTGNTYHYLKSKNLVY